MRKPALAKMSCCWALICAEPIDSASAYGHYTCFPLAEAPIFVLEFVLRPWRLIVLFLASHLNREQQRIIEYLQVGKAG